jgi:exopolyphosphatase / guanosine-5'-triphosphate,3'-diphosphate pyrophosphatase
MDMIVALVDMGSNTVRMNVYDCESKQPVMLFSTKSNTGLIGYVVDGKMSVKGIKAAINVILEFKDIVSHFRVDKFIVFATASLRNIQNTKQAMEIIEKEADVKIDLISGEDEARLDFIGATRLIQMDHGMLIDIGGGSTELVTFENKKIIDAVSIPIGSLSLYRKCVSRLLPDKKEIKILQKTIDDEMNKVKHIFKKDYFLVCGVGGTLRAGRKLNQVLFDRADTENDIEAAELKKLLKIISTNDRNAIDIILQNVSDRVHTIIPGLMILNEAVKRSKGQLITVSDYGVREGYLFSRVLEDIR